MSRTARATFIAFVPFLCAFIARPTHAQAPEGSDRLSAKAVSESLVVLRRLDDSVRVRPPSAAAWFHQGMVAWSLWERARHQPPAGLDWTTLAPMADTSLRRALDLDPDNPLYFRALTQFLVSTGVSFRLYGTYGEFNNSLDNARASGDAVRIADAATNAGRVYWLRYDNLTCESVRDNALRLHTLPPPPIEGVRPLPRAARAVGPFSFLVNFDRTSTAGEIDYLKAEALFREAYEAAPDHNLAFRHYAALVADQQRWPQLAALARDMISRAPSDGWGWMALGLATHKLGDAKTAIAAFDTALMRLDPDERARLDRIERVLDPREAARLPTKSDSARDVAERFYWRNADPLWSVEGTEPRVEFLARVTYAELRWTQEELNVNGVNTDYGNGYVRTGSRPMLNTMGDPLGCKPTFQAWYVWNDTTVLHGPATNWARVGRMRVDSIPSQVVRFRAGHDSTDAVFTALPPVAAISRTSSSANVPVRTDFWIITATLEQIARDSIVPTKPGPQRFVQRLAPGGYIYRTEASAEGVSSAGRATAGIIAGNDTRTGFMLTGSGISDLFLATRAVPRSATPRRWIDFDITPLLGPVAAKSQIALLWENYEFGEDNGSAQYDVVITVKRDITPVSNGRGGTTAPARRNIGAGIIGGIGASVHTTRSVDQVEFKFDRTIPHAPVIVENVAITLGDSPPGTYLVTMRITDRVTGKQFGHTQRFAIPTPGCKPVLFSPC